ncbi:MAG: DUF1295 domain-containing protein [Actinobacteria bacterium]|nr:DUF1295 domain-containing protein [Actinomycetota bacterium]
MTWWELVLLALGFAAALQLVLYAVQLRTRSATAVDAGWAGSLVGIAVLYALLGGGEPEHRVLAALLPGLAFGRVAIVVLRRLGGEEDRRYQELRARWRERGREQRSFFVFYQAQALVAVVLSVPFLATAFNGHGGIEPLEWAGVAVWLAGALLEAEADRELAGFRRDPASTGQVIDTGLWRYSRHPNYFGQWLTWCGYALVALAAPWGWVGLLAPALMLYLILYVTGVPPTEEQTLRSRGEAYRRYQQRTSVFVPLPPREAA